MTRILCVLFGLFLGLSVQANPLRTTYQAKIVKPDGHPLEASNVSFRFSILDPSASCVLYVEDFSTINMTDSGGLISFSLGAGVRSFPTSGTAQTFANTFNNGTTSFSCQTPGIYTPAAHDNRKVVMQFNDGLGWQTLPAMIINAVPYAMYAWKADDSTTLNGKADTSFVQYTAIPTCTASQALQYNGASFQCITAGGGGVSYTVTASDVTNALGYTPGNPSQYATQTSFTTVTSTVNSIGTSVTTLTSTISNLSTSLSAITSSQWLTSGTSISYNAGNVGIGTVAPTSVLDVYSDSNPKIATFTGGATGVNQQVVFQVLNNNASAPASSNLDYSMITADTLKASGTTGGIALIGLGEHYSGGYGNANEGVLTAGNKSTGLFINNRTTGDIRFGAIGIEQVRIKASNGYVGIGTSAPTSLLTVGSNLGASYALTANSTSQYGSLIQTLDTSGTNAAAFWVRTNNGSVTSQLLRVQNNGLVGIGTGTPSYTLTVSGTIASLHGGFVFPDGSVQSTAVTSPWVASGSAINFASGHVGIGLTNPSYPLAVSGVIQSTNGGFKFPDSSTQTTAFVSGSAAIIQQLGYVPLSSASSSQWISTSNNIYYTAGAVGIGTSAPTQTLDVNGVARVQSWLNVGLTPTTQSAGDALIINQSGSSAKFRMHASSGGSQPTDGFSILTDTTNSTILNNETGYLALGSSETASLYIRGANGNVGIGAGNSVPLYALDVSGTIRSSSGGFRFPDNSVQTTAATGSQWSNITNGINYNGWVGIGTSTVKVPLSVNYDSGVYSFTYLDIPTYAGAVITASGPAEAVSGVTKPVLVLSRPNQSSWSSVARFELGRHSTTANANTMLNIKLSDRGIANEGDNAPTVMTMFSTGKVGINDTTPTSTLTVGGNIEMSTGKLIFADGSSQTAAAMRPIYLTYSNTVTVSAAGNSTGTMTSSSWVAPATGTVIMTYNKIMPYLFACAQGNFGISLRVNGAAGSLGNQAFISAINRYQNGEVAFPQITDMWAVTAGTTYTITTEYFAQNFSSCTLNTRGNSSGRDTIRIEYQ